MTQRQAFEVARRALTFSLERKSSMCEPFLSLIPVTGAALSVLAISSAQSTICASDRTAERLDELQFDLGEGPCWEALSSRAPALHGDIRIEDNQTWPTFAHAVRAEPVGAMFAFPMIVGSLEIGAVDLYNATPGTLTSEQVSDASALAHLAAWQVLRRILVGNEVPEIDGPAYSRREIHQATGMVIAQLDISADDAALLLRAHAFSSGRSVREIANDVVERRLDFAVATGKNGRDENPPSE